MPSEEIKTYTLKEIAEHSSPDSLWLLIDNGVYDVSKFMDEHPGGPEPLFDWAGKDATDAFEDAGHSADARELMKSYRVGELSEDEQKEINKEKTSKKCFWIRTVLLPVGVLVTALLAYKLFVRFSK
ncbi:cytochrome b5-like [Uloborus diversus]|uniref:cytochrome b5-like n=1 Tax=Uloborus diversus TaxID=327109 RepID=UPI00240A7294|nr:cytochrome b5-like [Uloborus diversus]XP_054720369.1 cytochrome b5-like [Uloborus diversus]